MATPNNIMMAIRMRMRVGTIRMHVDWHNPDVAVLLLKAKPAAASVMHEQSP